MANILFLVSAMEAGGAERVASTLANAWTERGHSVTLMPTFSGRGNCFYPLSPNVDLVYLADLVPAKTRTWVTRFIRLLALRRFMAMNRPDVIVSFLTHVNVAAVLASIGLRIPVIVCERCDPFAMPLSRRLQLACRLTYPLAAALTVQTPALAAKYKASGGPLTRLRVIPNPVSRSMQNLQPQGNTATTKQLLSIGRLDGQKQFDVLITVFARLAQQNSDWRLRIVGEVALRNVLQQQITALGLDQRIELAGQSAGIEAELAKADLFALTSRYEGFPNALLEAMAAGLPCVAFDCPSGPREITRNGQVAFLVPLNDELALERALQQLMVDAELRQTLGRNARASVLERFALDNILQHWDMLFQELGVRL